MDLVFIGDIVEKNGKTIKENNLEILHKIPIGTLVEIKFEDDPRDGCRLKVKKHIRDCDGTPLYMLGMPGEDYWSTGGWSDDSLIIIK